MTSYNKIFANLSIPEFFQSKMPKCNTIAFVEFKSASVIPEDMYEKLFTGISRHDTSTASRGKGKKHGKSAKNKSVK